MTTWLDGTCATNGIDLHYLRTHGRGPSIVLLHGLLGSGACWTPVARVLEPISDLVMPDARGHGRSTAPAHGYRYDDHAADILGLVHGLGLDRPLLVGHSMGGMTAALAASRAPGLLCGLALVDPTFLSPERQREVHASDVAAQHRQALALPKAALVAQALARHPHRSRQLVDIQAGARLATSLAAFDVLIPPNPDYRALVRSLDLPVLLVIGDNPVVTPDVAAELRTLNARLCVVQVANAGHGLPFDQPDRLANLITASANQLS